MKAENIARNRKIKADRVYRTLGRMTWWRVVLGILLLVFVFFLSGTVSERLAAKGRFNDAERFIISQKWLETYRPELKAFIESGVFYENGDFEKAYEGFSAIEDYDDAAAMCSACALKLASAAFDAEDYSAVLGYLAEIDVSLLNADDAAFVEQLRSELLSLSKSQGGAN